MPTVTGKPEPPGLRQGAVLFFRLFKLARSYWVAVARGIAIGLVVGLVGMATPYVSKLLIDEVYPTGDVELMHVLVGGILAVSVTTAAMGAVRGYYSLVIGAQLNTAATLMFFNHLQHLPIRFFDRHRVGEIMSRFQDLSGSLGAVSRVFETVLLRGVYLVLVPPVMFWLNWKLALLSIITLPLTIAVTAISGRVLRRYWKQSAEAYADLSAFQVETLTHIRTLKTMAAEHRVYREAGDRLRLAFKLRLKAGGLGIVVGAVNGVIRVGGVALFTWFAWTLILQEQLTLGGYIAFTAYQGYLVGPLSQFAALVTSLQQTAVTFARAFEYLDEPTEQDPALAFTGPCEIRHRLRGALRLECVSFAYSPTTPTLQQIDLDVPAGTVLAVVGPSGAGKSTLFRLLCRIEEPDSGAIRADGIPIKGIPLSDLRRQVAVVWQEVALTQGTIWENLTLGVDSPTEAEVEDVVTACQLGDLIANSPDGFQTPVAEWGATLSGGQRQRIAIARALLRNTPILLLDEATANLDVDTEAAVIRAVLSRVPRRSLIYATHRLTTAELADRIAVLDKGRLVGVGTHAELLAGCGLYHDLQGQRRVALGTRRTSY